MQRIGDILSQVSILTMAAEQPVLSQSAADWMRDAQLSWLWQALLFIAILVAFWVGAVVASSGILAFFKRIHLDERLRKLLSLPEAAFTERSPAFVLSRILYWSLLVLGLVAALNYAGITLIAAPFQEFLTTLTNRALPALLKAVTILAVAYVIALLLRPLVRGALALTGVDKRLRQLQPERAAGTPLSDAVGSFIYWAILFIGLIGALDALQLHAIAAPLSKLFDRVLALIPALATAILILLGGYLLARLVQTVLKNVLNAVGLDRIPAKLQIEKLFTQRSLSDIIGLFAFFLIVVHAIIAALDKLELQSLSEPLGGLVGRFWEVLPSFVVAAAIVIAGTYIARIVRDLTQGLLSGLGFDAFLEKFGIVFVDKENSEKAPTKLPDRPSALVGTIAQLGIVLLVLVQALETVQLAAWADLTRGLLSFLFANGLIALLILTAGLVVGNYARSLIRGKGDEEHTPVWVGSAVRTGILIFAGTMALQHLQVAPQFILLAFGLLFGALCLTLALAFGLGSRDIAGKMIQDQVDRRRSERRATPSEPPTSPII